MVYRFPFNIEAGTGKGFSKQAIGSLLSALRRDIDGFSAGFWMTIPAQSGCKAAFGDVSVRRKDDAQGIADTIKSRLDQAGFDLPREEWGKAELNNWRLNVTFTPA